MPVTFPFNRDAKKKTTYNAIFSWNFFFYLGFLSQTFTISRTTGESRDYLLNISLSLPLRHRLLDITRRLLQRYHFCKQLVAGLEPGNSERKSLITKLSANYLIKFAWIVALSHTEKLVSNWNINEKKLNLSKI